MGGHVENGWSGDIFRRVELEETVIKQKGHIQYFNSKRQFMKGDYTIFPACCRSIYV